VLVTIERFLPARGTFRAILASESHWLQPMLVFSVHWWPALAGVGNVYLFDAFTLYGFMAIVGLYVVVLRLYPD